MAKKPPPRKSKRDDGRRAKKKVSVLTTEKVEYIDYKDVNLLKRFMSDRAKIRARRVSGNDTQQQAEVARAIKNAREMALLPYTTRVTTQRNNRGRDRDRDRGDRGDRGPRDGAPRDDDQAPTEEAGEAVDAPEGVEVAEAATEEVAAAVDGTEES